MFEVCFVDYLDFFGLRFLVIRFKGDDLFEIVIVIESFIEIIVFDWMNIVKEEVFVLYIKLLGGFWVVIISGSSLIIMWWWFKESCLIIVKIFLFGYDVLGY